ncbi:MAG: YqaE/Pmp3 family membrane protein [Candidatus Omnitrophica bacterium]|nr:YqaE/Pmp3 family membrane protein [Candidatus Omnitrophota bacterium]
MSILKIILAIFLPPVAVFMQVGATKHFWINIVLVFLFFVPSVIHALWVVITNQKA